MTSSICRPETIALHAGWRAAVRGWDIADP